MISSGVSYPAIDCYVWIIFFVFPLLVILEILFFVICDFTKIIILI